MFQYVGPLLFLNVFGTTLGFLAANDAFAAYPTITNVTSVNRFRADYFRPDWLEMVESSGVSSPRQWPFHHRLTLLSLPDTQLIIIPFIVSILHRSVVDIGDFGIIRDSSIAIRISTPKQMTERFATSRRNAAKTMKGRTTAREAWTSQLSTKPPRR